MVEFRDFWDLIRCQLFRVTDFQFVTGWADGRPTVLVQLDGDPDRRYIGVARLGDWPPVDLVWRLARERLEGAIDLVWVPEYPEQRGLRFWYAKGRPRKGAGEHGQGSGV